MYLSTKTYGHDVGLSAVFRQHLAKSHCNKLHGYALAITLVFACDVLDERNWVVDFGALKSFKAVLEKLFDHRVIIAADDPKLELMRAMEREGLLDLVVLRAVGCEYFAYHVNNLLHDWLQREYLPSLNQAGIFPPHGLRVHRVTVAEHGANSGVFEHNSLNYVVKVPA